MYNKSNQDPCLKRDDVNYDHVLQITDVSTKFRKSTLNSSKHRQKQVTLQASDKNGCCIEIKLASQLNDTSRNLKTGVFIKLQQFHILKY